MYKRECVGECVFLQVRNDRINCLIYDTQLKIDEYDPENYTLTVLRCDKCVADAMLEEQMQGQLLSLERPF